MKTYDLNELEDLLVSLLEGTRALLNKDILTIDATSVKEALTFVMENDPEIDIYCEFMGMILDEYTE